MTKVFVGLSGGVDSAVTAKLLIDQGYAVTGVFIKIWQPEFLECTWKQDRLSAKRVAAALGVPFLEIDLSEYYKQKVVEDMVQSYAAGFTPNPDVLCNEYIKFGAFKEWAREHGADLIATGHHACLRRQARIREVSPRGKHNDLRGRYELHRGKDVAKDQAYFLYRLTEHDLKNILFPIGEYTKGEVRAIARKTKLPNANRPDSQGLCFVGEISIGEFLSYYIPMHRGDALDQNGNVIGTHEGSTRYTIGERHGFALTAGDGTPHYIIAIDTAKNTITVSPNLNDACVSFVVLTDVTWVNEKPEEGKFYDAEVRYHQKPHTVHIQYKDSSLHVFFTKPQIIAHGQSVVLYEGSRCLGGGVVS